MLLGLIRAGDDDEAALALHVAQDQSADHETRHPSRVHRETALWEIERALAAIANGTYGVCSQCGEPIGALRLNALPEAPLCLLCAFP